MSASSHLTADANTMIANGPTVQTAKNAATGTLLSGTPTYPTAGIDDYVGMQNLILTKCLETKEALVMLANITDSSDPNLTILNADIANFSASGGASTTLLTDSTTMITAGPTVQTAKNAATGTLLSGTPTYPTAGICDYIGLQHNYRGRLRELLETYTLLYNITDSSDPNYTTLANDILTIT